LLNNSKKEFKYLSREITKTGQAIKEDVHEGVETLVSWFNPAHKRLKKRYFWYEAWHKNPHYKEVHWAIVALCLILIVGLILSTLTELINPRRAQALSTWTQSTQAEFDAGTKNQVQTTDISGGEVKLSGGDTFNYRRAITIDNTSGGALTDYQVKLTLDNSNFAFDQVKSNGDDIRFLDDNDTTNLSYWTQVWDNEDHSAEVWIKIPSIPASSTKTIYMHYGSSTAMRNSSITDTFIFGDDFTDDTSACTGWTSLGREGAWSVICSAGGMHMGSSGSVTAVADDTNDLTDFIAEADTTTTGLGVSNGVSMTFRRPVGNDWLGYMVGLNPTGSGTNSTPIIKETGTMNDFVTLDSGIGVPYTFNEHTYQFKTIATGNDFKFYVDDNLQSSVTDSSSPSGRIGLGTYNTTVNFDNVRVRKYAAIEPTTSISGATINSTAHASQPDWYDANWGYRTALTVDNTSNVDSLTNYQMAINLDTATLINAGKMRADGNDIRFADADGTSLLDYWLEVGINTNATKLWVEIPSVPASSTKTVYIYYGNATASSVSSGANTFLFFDDFSGDLSQWDTGNFVWEKNGPFAYDAAVGYNTPSVSGGNLLLDGTRSAAASATEEGVVSSWWGKSVTTKTGILESNFAIDANIWFSQSYSGDYAAFYNSMILGVGKDKTNYIYGMQRDRGQLIQTRDSGEGPRNSNYDNAPSGNNPQTSTWQKVQYIYNDNGSTAYIINNNLTEYAVSQSLSTRKITLGFMHVVPSATVTEKVDWVFAHKTTQNPPIFSAGASETNNSTVIYLTFGDLTSSAYNTTQFCDFDTGTISWDGTVPASTELKFQLRTADTEAGLTSATWYGPTGTTDYYTTSGSAINAIHNGNQWIQYKAYFVTTNVTTTPILNSISVTYNLGDKTISADTSWAEGTYNMDNLTVNNEARLTIAGGSTINVNGNLTITDGVTAGSNIAIQSKNNTAQVGGEWVGVGSTINAVNIVIDPNSKITAEGEGYTSTSADGNGPGGGLGGGSGAGGAGYGGAGGNGVSYSGGASYGSATAPVDLGSAGGGAGGTDLGGAGGGAIRLSLSGTLTLNGRVRVNGQNDVGTGGGAAGSIYVTAANIAGLGFFEAVGGNGDTGCGGGAGGRIVVLYTTASSFDGEILAMGGTGIDGSVRAGAGTVKYGAMPTASLVAPTDGATGVAYIPDLQTTLDDASDRADIVAQLQYKQYDTNPSCSSETWASGVVTSTSRTVGGATESGWSGGGVTNGLYDVSTGSKTSTYTPTLVGKKYYCWRTRDASLNTGDFSLGNDVTSTSGWSNWTSARKFFTNTPPEVQNVSASQGTDGIVSTSYQYKDEDSDLLHIGLFYRNSASGWALNMGGSLSPGATTVTITDASRFPSTGTILVDDEEITYAGKSGNDLTGCTRGANFSTASAHVDSSAIYFKATTLTGDTVKQATPVFQDGSLSWTVKTDYNGYYDTAGVVRITVNDTYGKGYVGANASSIVLSTKDPVSPSINIAGGATYTNAAVNALALSASDDLPMSMRFSNNDSAWSAWEDYGTSKSWDITDSAYGGTSADGSKTVYVQYKDTKNNTASADHSIIYDKTPPVGPTSINERNISITESGLYRDIVDWNLGSDPYFRRYQVLRSTNGTDYSQIGSDITDINTTYLVDLNLTSTDTYYYKIKTEDWGGNYVISDPVTATRPLGPSISAISSGTPGSDNATITWTTITKASSLVEYKSGNCSGSFLKAGNLDESVVSHSVNLTGLTYNATYSYKVRSRDGGLYEQIDDNSGGCYTFLTAPAPSEPPTGTIALNNSSAYTNSATVNLAIAASDPNSGGYVSQMKFSNNGSLWSDYETYSGTKVWDITNATYGGTSENGAKTTYVKLKDNFNNESTATISGSITYDNVAPTVSVPSDLATNSATPTITWSAATDSTSGVNGYYIKIGTTSGGSEVLAETFIGDVLKYTTISSLSDGTYYAQIKAKDNASNISSYTSSATIAVNSAAPISNAIIVVDNGGYTNSSLVNLTLSSSGATQMSFSNNGVDWSAWISYATSFSNWNLISGYGGTDTQGEKTVYARFKNSYNNISSSVVATTVYDSIAPVISSVMEMLGITGTTASVTWTTNEIATSEMYYDIVSHLGGVYTDYAYSSKDVTNFDNNHRRDLSSLLNGTKYYYILRSVDKATNAKFHPSDFPTSEASFTTAVLPTADSISSGTPGVVSATITWSSNTNTNDTLTYGTTTSYGAGVGNPNASTTSHSVTINGLTKGTTYHFKIRAIDANGNIVSDTDHSFVTADITTPPTGSISINNSDLYTNSATTNLAISASTTGESASVSQMKFSNNGSSWSDYETYSGTKVWDVTNATYGGTSSEGNKKVYLKLKDNYGNETTSEISSSIIYDITGPVANTPSATTPTNETKPTWTWTASTDDISGVAGYYVKIGTTLGGSDILAETWIGNNTSYTSITALSDGTYYLSLKAKDNANNSGSYNTSSGGVTVKTTAPTDGSISINGGAVYTTSTLVTLTIGAIDALYMNISNDGISWNGWETYAVTRDWTLSSGDGLKVVYIKFKDTAGNESAPYTDAITLDATAPVCSSINSSSVTYNSVLITWTTSKNSTSQVEYGLDTSYGSLTTLDENKNINHRVILADLIGGKTYHYRVRSKDAAGNEGVSLDNTFTTMVYPVLNTISSSGITNNAATVTWATNISTDSFVEYGTSTNYGSISGKSDSLTSHSVTLNGLLASTTYHYRVRSTDSYGNIVISDDYNFTTSSTASPTIAISATTVTSPQAKDIVTTDITIVWATAGLASSYVDYGLTTNYDQSAGKEEMVTSHAVTLIGLQSNTTYHYRVRSVDKDGNVFVSADFTVVTPALAAPSISAVTITDVTLTSAVISWKTSKTASSQVEYGTNPDSFSSSTSEDTSPNTSHTVKLDNLTSGVTYYFRVKSRDSSTGDLLISNAYAFSTITFPSISDVSISDITESRVTIAWNTNVATDAVVEFGKTNVLDLQQGVNELATNHKVTLNNLDASTTYYYRVRSRDIYGNSATSGIATFSSQADTMGPVINDIKSEVSTIGSGDTARVQVIVSWSTDEPATSAVEYGTGLGVTLADGNKVYERKTQEDNSYNQSHVVILSDLKASTTYHLRVKSTDKVGNTNYSQDYTVLTPAIELSLIQVIVGTLEDTFGWLGNLKGILSK